MRNFQQDVTPCGRAPTRKLLGSFGEDRIISHSHFNQKIKQTATWSLVLSGPQ